MEVKQENILIEGTVLPGVYLLRVTQPSLTRTKNLLVHFLFLNRSNEFKIKIVNKAAKFKDRHETLEPLKHNQDGEEEVDMRGESWKIHITHLQV